MSSFKKAAPRSGGGSVGKIPKGTTPSLTNGQLLTSSGIKSLDYLLKGGIAVGTVVLVETGARSSYADVLLKYFLSQGVCHNHHITLISGDTDPQAFLKSCPKSKDIIKQQQTPSPSPSQVNTQTQGVQQDMQIAWRYQHLPKVNAELGSGQRRTLFSSRYQHTFNLQESVTDEDLAREGIQCVDLRPQSLCERDTNSSNRSGNVFDYVMDCINEAVEPFQAVPKKGPLLSETVHRIALHNVGSPAWWALASRSASCGDAVDACLEDYGQEDHVTVKKKVTAICNVLMQLRAVARRSCSVFFVTLPDGIATTASQRSKIHRTVDVALRLDGFAGTSNEHNPLLKEYHGFFRVLKVPHLNRLVPLTTDTADLAFKLKQNGLAVEKIHLPPELAETANRAQVDS